MKCLVFNSRGVALHRPTAGLRSFRQRLINQGIDERAATLPLIAVGGDHRLSFAANGLPHNWPANPSRSGVAQRRRAD